MAKNFTVKIRRDILVNKPAKRDNLPYLRTYLNKHRVNAKLSGDDLSLMLGVSKSYYFALEHGTRGHRLSVGLLNELSEVLNVDVHLLLDQELNYITERKKYKDYKRKKEK